MIKAEFWKIPCISDSSALFFRENQKYVIAIFLKRRFTEIANLSEIKDMYISVYFHKDISLDFSDVDKKAT